MSEHEQQDQVETDGGQEIPDLEISSDEADLVKGGRRADPDEGGE